MTLAGFASYLLFRTHSITDAAVGRYATYREGKTLRDIEEMLAKARRKSRDPQERVNFLTEELGAVVNMSPKAKEKL